MFMFSLICLHSVGLTRKKKTQMHKNAMAVNQQDKNTMHTFKEISTGHKIRALNMRPMAYVQVSLAEGNAVDLFLFQHQQDPVKG